jgi:uncharacterized membrane protein
MKLARDQLDLKSRELLGFSYRELGAGQRRVVREFARRGLVTRNMAAAPLRPSAGERWSEAVARIGGSWVFAACSMVLVAACAIVAGFLLLRAGERPINPYPYLALNLVPSTLAALLAPVILMSQSWQARRDREAAENDYAVNLKAELEVMRLHEQLKTLRAREIADLLAHQVELLQELRDRPRSSAA